MHVLKTQNHMAVNDYKKYTCSATCLGMWKTSISYIFHRAEHNKDCVCANNKTHDFLKFSLAAVGGIITHRKD